MATIAVSTELRTYTCGSCGGFYAIGEAYAAKKQENGGYWHCPYCENSWGYDPNGCPLAQAKKRADELAAQLVRERAAHDQAKATVRTQAETLAKEKNKATKLKRRIANGVCPCCHRTVSQLARHIATKHPEYAKSGT